MTPSWVMPKPPRYRGNQVFIAWSALTVGVTHTIRSMKSKWRAIGTTHNRWRRQASVLGVKCWKGLCLPFLFPMKNGHDSARLPKVLNSRIPSEFIGAKRINLCEMRPADLVATRPPRPLAPHASVGGSEDQPTNPPAWLRSTAPRARRSESDMPANRRAPLRRRAIERRPR